MTSRAAKALAALAIAGGLGLAACGAPSSAAAPATTKGSIPNIPSASSSMPGMSSMPATAGAPASAAKPVAGTAVAITNFAFSPQNLTIKVGATVTWTNMDTDAHTSTAKDGTWTSKPLDTGQSYSYTFTKPGTYSYYCTIHPFMVAQVVVS